MENDYILPHSLFSVLGDLFLDCNCGCTPYLQIRFDGVTSEIEYEVVCASCGCTVTHLCEHEGHDLDFGLLAVDWNSRIPED